MIRLDMIRSFTKKGKGKKMSPTLVEVLGTARFLYLFNKFLFFIIAKKNICAQSTYNSSQVLNKNKKL